VALPIFFSVPRDLRQGIHPVQSVAMCISLELCGDAKPRRKLYSLFFLLCAPAKSRLTFFIRSAYCSSPRLHWFNALHFQPTPARRQAGADEEANEYSCLLQQAFARALCSAASDSLVNRHLEEPHTPHRGCHDLAGQGAEQPLLPRHSNRRCICRQGHRFAGVGVRHSWRHVWDVFATPGRRPTTRAVRRRGHAHRREHHLGRQQPQGPTWRAVEGRSESEARPR